MGKGKVSWKQVRREMGKAGLFKSFLFGNALPSMALGAIKAIQQREKAKRGKQREESKEKKTKRKKEEKIR